MNVNFKILLAFALAIVAISAASLIARQAPAWFHFSSFSPAPNGPSEWPAPQAAL